MTDQSEISEEVNPYQSPMPIDRFQADLAELGSPIYQIEVADLSVDKRLWTIGMYADRLRFMSPGEPGFDVTRDQLPHVVTIGDRLFIRRSVVVKVNGKRVIFKFSVDDFNILSEWIGPPTVVDLQVSQRKRLVLFLVIALMFVLSSLPMDGDLAAGIDAVPFDLVNFTLGIFLAFTTIGSRCFPHRLFFLADSLWFACLAISTTYDVLNGTSWLWMFVVALEIHLVLSGIRQYRRFATMVRTDSAVTIA